MKKIRIGNAIKNGLIKNQGYYITEATTTDLNLLLDTGDYITDSSTQNTPENDYGVLLVRVYGSASIGKRITQEFISRSGKLYFRFKFVNLPFTQWKEI